MTGLEGHKKEVYKTEKQKTFSPPGAYRAAVSFIMENQELINSRRQGGVIHEMHSTGDGRMHMPIPG
jgi:hypothetical protein